MGFCRGNFVAGGGVVVVGLVFIKGFVVEDFVSGAYRSRRPKQNAWLVGR